MLSDPTLINKQYKELNKLVKSSIRKHKNQANGWKSKEDFEIIIVDTFSKMYVILKESNQKDCAQSKTKKE